MIITPQITMERDVTSLVKIEQKQINWPCPNTDLLKIFLMHQISKLLLGSNTWQGLDSFTNNLPFLFQTVIPTSPFVFLN